MNYLCWLEKQIHWHVGGSSAVNPLDQNDTDIIVLVEDYAKASSALRLELGFYPPDESAYNMLMHSKLYEKDDIDMIVTDSYECYILWLKATAICKTLNLINRDDRIKVHHILLERKDSGFERPTYSSDVF